MGQGTTVTKVITLVTVRARTVAPLGASCRDQIIPSTVHRHLLGSSSMVTLTLLLLVGSGMVTPLLRLLLLLTVITVGNTVRTARLLLSMVSLVITTHSTVRVGVPRAPQGLQGVLQGGLQTGLMHPNGTLKHPREGMGRAALTLVIMWTSHHLFRFTLQVDFGIMLHGRTSVLPADDTCMVAHVTLLFMV